MEVAVQDRWSLKTGSPVLPVIDGCLYFSVAVPYAWDEPMLPPYLTVSVPGGTSATYNMHVLEEGAQLCYENFIYIAFTATFRRWV